MIDGFQRTPKWLRMASGWSVAVPGPVRAALVTPACTAFCSSMTGGNAPSRTWGTMKVLLPMRRQMPRGDRSYLRRSRYRCCRSACQGRLRSGHQVCAPIGRMVMAHVSNCEPGKHVGRTAQRHDVCRRSRQQARASADAGGRERNDSTVRTAGVHQLCQKPCVRRPAGGGVEGTGLDQPRSALTVDLGLAGLLSVLGTVRAGPMASGIAPQRVPGPGARVDATSRSREALRRPYCSRTLVHRQHHFRKDSGRREWRHFPRGRKRIRLYQSANGFHVQGAAAGRRRSGRAIPPGPRWADPPSARV